MRINFSVAVYVIIACVAYAAASSRRAKERETQALALAAGLTRAKLDALRLQLQPHFLFNTLNAISALVHRDPRAADELIADLSELLRLSLESSVDEVPLRRELEILDRYLAIEQTRLGARLRVVRTIDPAALDVAVPTFILQPLAENAVRHGIEPRSEPGQVTVTARVVNDLLELTVADDGVGLRPAAAGSRRGIGLTNAEERLRTLHGERARLELRSPEGGGVAVVLTLPLRRAATKDAAA
jgi:sensor histidine kinase YesM